MIAEIIPNAYDAIGRKVLRPDLRRNGIHPTFPMGRYVNHSLAIHCRTISDVRQFLCGCRSVSDQEQFGKRDYWQPPDEFEKTKKGDCDCFALWTWRQFMSMGFDARIVFGRSGRYGIGHAWVTFRKGDKYFLVDPTYRLIGDKFPRLSTLHYHPKMSAAWDGSRISFYAHEEKKFVPRFSEVLPMVWEWVSVWSIYGLRLVPKLLFRRRPATSNVVPT